IRRSVLRPRYSHGRSRARPLSRVSETEPETKTLSGGRRPTTHRRGPALRWRVFRWHDKSEALRKCEGKRDNGTYVSCNKTICSGGKKRREFEPKWAELYVLPIRA